MSYLNMFFVYPKFRSTIVATGPRTIQVQRATLGQHVSCGLLNVVYHLSLFHVVMFLISLQIYKKISKMMLFKQKKI